MYTVYIALAAFVGGVVAALLGFLESHEGFDSRKFGASAIRALIAALIFALANQGAPSAVNILYAFLGGAGIDVLVNRVGGSFGNPTFPLPSKGG
jgi:hypothetical protein